MRVWVLHREKYRLGRLTFVQRCFIFATIENINISEGLFHERIAADNWISSRLVFSSGSYFAEVRFPNLNGSDPPGGG
jgi:hypothetical protein